MKEWEGHFNGASQLIKILGRNCKSKNGFMLNRLAFGDRSKVTECIYQRERDHEFYYGVLRMVLIYGVT